MALILMRRLGDEITLTLNPDYTKADLEELVENGISVTVIQIDGSQIKLAFEAPDSVAIMRSELLESSGAQTSTS